MEVQLRGRRAQVQPLFEVDEADADGLQLFDQGDQAGGPSIR
jgi:hypothetical protein